MAQTPIWPLEVPALNSTGDMTANSLAGYLSAVKTIVDAIPNGGAFSDIDAAITAIKAVTDVIPDAGALTGIAADAASAAGAAADVTAIKAVTDVLPDAGALTSISDETDKIDGEATDGLSGVANSLAYRTAEIEVHVHHWERWMGLAAAPDAEVHRADSIRTTSAPFVVTAGNDAWGAWYQFLGSTDTPTDGVSDMMDAHEMVVVAASKASAIYKIEVAWGASGDIALAAGTYTELIYWAGANVSRAAPVPIQMQRVACGTKGWIRLWCVGDNATTMGFFIGGHEYDH